MSSALESVVDTSAAARPVRVVTAASLFDGHDAAINIMRRILQSQGAEVIHLGHDRSVEEIVDAAIQEDAHAVAVSSYQGGHVVFFSYMMWMSLLTRYPASGMQSFTFLSPVWGVVAGVILLGESVSLLMALGMALIGLGLYLVNRPRKLGA